MIGPWDGHVNHGRRKTAQALPSGASLVGARLRELRTRTRVRDMMDASLFRR